jgi:penicillin-binding protein 1C
MMIPYRLVARESLKLLDRHGQLIADVRDPDRQTNYQSLDEVPVLVLSGLIMREDRRFRSHRGIDLMALARAMWSNLTQSGSTQ